MDSNLISKIFSDIFWISLGIVLGYFVGYAYIKSSESIKKYDDETHEIKLSVKVIKLQQAISWYRYALKVLADRGEEFANVALNAGEKYYGK